VWCGCCVYIQVAERVGGVGGGGRWDRYSVGAMNGKYCCVGCFVICPRRGILGGIGMGEWGII
jgi:hypothetical protein